MERESMNKYLTLFKNKIEVQSSDGRTIRCNYKSHQAYSANCQLSGGLHYAFIRYAEERSYSKGYALRTAINLFLDFKIEYDSQNPSTLSLDSLFQVSPEVFRAFDFYAKRNQCPKGIATCLKSALKSVAKDYDEGLPNLELPFLSDPRPSPSEPLSQECFQQLSSSLKTYINYLYEKIQFRDVVLTASPYELSALQSNFKSLHLWLPDTPRTLSTLLLKHNPFGVPHSEFSAIARSTHDANLSFDPNNITEAIYLRYNHPRIIARRRNAAKLISIDDLFESYFPTQLDQAAVFLFIQLQTGWNKETVLALDGNDFEHALTGALRSKSKLIYSEKERSQSNKKPFSDAKTFLAPSDSADKYSAYNLILLAEKLSRPLATLQLDANAKNDKRHNPLFLCIRSYAKMCSVSQPTRVPPGRFVSISNKNAWESGVKRFLEIFDIRENGDRLETVGQLSHRLRPTWILFNRDVKQRPLSVIALQQGHKSISTTDIHYDSSGPAKRLRRDRLRLELSGLVATLREKKFTGLLAKRAASVNDAEVLRFFNIPGHEKSLWACSNSFAADWPGAEKYLTPGSKCSVLHQCLFCSRVCIFEDSLPFLMHRQGAIQRQLESFTESNFDSPLSDELSIIDYILNQWQGEHALKDAARYVRKYDKVMFDDIKSLSIIFED
jgi:hypothetical protein